MKSLFAEQVQSEFAFLPLEYDFVCVSVRTDAVKYQSVTVFVEMQFDAVRSFEVALQIGLLESNESFSLSELLSAKSAPEDSFCQASTSSKIELCVEKMSFLLDKYGREYLLGEKDAFDFLRLHRQAVSQKAFDEKALNRARSQALSAWNERNFAQYQKMLFPFRSQLSAAEKVKLKYAEKQMKSE